MRTDCFPQLYYIDILFYLRAPNHCIVQHLHVLAIPATLKSPEEVEEEEDDGQDENDFSDNDSGFDGATSINVDATADDIHEAGGNLSLEELNLESEKLMKTIEEGEGENASDGSSSKFASGFAKLKNDYDTHVRRLLAKLASEQIARSNLEDELDSINQEKSKDQSTGRGSIFKGIGKYFRGESGGAHRMTKQERALKDTVFELTNKLSNTERLLETTKESHRIVLETKESVVRSLLKQNTEISFERDNLNMRVDSLTTALDHLTGLLRNLQSSSVEESSTSAGSCKGGVISTGGATVPQKRVSITGGGGSSGV